MSVFEECWLPSWKMNSSRCRRKWPHLCSCSANGLNFFQHPPRWSWHRSRGKQQDQIFLSLHDPSRPAKALQFFVGAAKSLQAALLTDAQLVSDGLSSLVLNGARVQMKAGGPFMYKPSLSVIFSSVFKIKSPMKWLAVISFTFNANVPVRRLIAA